jgi:hypothetical protein
MKPKRAKPIYAFAIKCRGQIDINSIDLSRDDLIHAYPVVAYSL